MNPSTLLSVLILGLQAHAAINEAPEAETSKLIARQRTGGGGGGGWGGGGGAGGGRGGGSGSIIPVPSSPSRQSDPACQWEGHCLGTNMGYPPELTASLRLTLTCAI
jgi:hypothetical protein